MPIRVTVEGLSSESNVQSAINSYEKDEIVLGRLPSSDLVLDQPDIDSRHAKIRIDRQAESETPKFFITDLGSARGTKVGDIKLEAFREIELPPNQPIVVGKYSLKLDEDGEQIIDLGQKGTELKDFSSVISSDTEATLLRDIAPQAEQKEGQQKAELKPEGPKATAKSSSKEAVKGKLDYGNVIDFDFEASKLIALRGQVTHRGAPLEGVEIDGGVLGSLKSDSEGMFRFPEFPEETTYRVAPKKDGFIFESEILDGKLNDVSSLVFKARKLFTINGTVKYRGQPFSEVEIDCGEFGKTRTDKNGVYCIPNVPENSEFTITAKKDGYVLRQTGRAVDAGQTH